jgi:DNA-binding beta-propeller fold protein YncE
MAAIICAVALLAASAGVIVTKTHAATPLPSAVDSPIVAAVRAVSAGSKAPGPSGYHLLKKIPLGGEGFWDYITFDPATRRLYISRGTRVVVLEVDSGKTVGEIPNTDGVHGIALAPEFNRGFTSNGRAGTVTIFDLKTLKVIGSAQAGTNPDAIIYDASSKRVFAMNGRSKNATAIDAATGNVVGTIPVDGKPEFAVADGAGHVYVNIEDKSEEQVIDSQNLKVTATWPLKPCQEPSGLAMDITHRRLFAGCDNKMMAVIDADSGKVVATPEIGEGVDANAFDAELGYAYASNGESGTLTVVHEESPDKYSVVENVPTQAHARTMAQDPKTHQVFLVTADFGPAPAATPDNAHPRPTMVKDSFVVLIFGK